MWAAAGGDAATMGTPAMADRLRLPRHTAGIRTVCESCHRHGLHSDVRKNRGHLRRPRNCVRDQKQQLLDGRGLQDLDAGLEPLAEAGQPLEVEEEVVAKRTDHAHRLLGGAFLAALLGFVMWSRQGSRVLGKGATHYAHVFQPLTGLLNGACYAPVDQSDTCYFRLANLIGF